jgi:hypothetical protein
LTSPVLPGSTAWMRLTLAGSSPGSTFTVPFIFDGLIRQKMK